MNTMKGQTLTDAVNNELAMVQKLLGMMLVAILKHIQIILVIIQHRNTLKTSKQKQYQRGHKYTLGKEL